MKCIATKNQFGYPLRSECPSSAEWLHLDHSELLKGSEEDREACEHHAFIPDTPFQQLIRETLDDKNVDNRCE